MWKFWFGFGALWVIFFTPSLLQADQPELEIPLEEHWKRIALPPSLLTNIFTPDFCDSNERVFIACIQGVATIFGFDKELKSVRKKGFVSKYAYEVSTDMDPMVLVRWKEDKENFLDKSLAMRQEELASWKELYPLAKAKKDFWESLLKLISIQDFYLEKESWITIEAVNSIYRVLEDPHAFLVPKAFLDGKSLAETKTFSGVGIKTRWAFLNNRRESFIEKLYDQGPAQKAGLKVGDWLVEVGGKKTVHLVPDEIALLLRGEKDTKVEVKVIRDATPLVFNLIRDQVVQEQVSSNLLRSQVGYLRIHDFELNQEMGKLGFCEKVEEEIHKLEKGNAKSLILDLRNNSSGQLVKAAVCVANLFLKQRRVVALYQDIIETNLLPSQHTTIEPQKWLKPMVVLINGQTSNMAEIVAGSLQDYYRAFLVGERSNGKASSQRTRVLHSKVSFSETTDIIYLPSGHTPERHPLNPDFEVFENGKNESSFYRTENDYVLVEKSSVPENPRKKLVKQLSDQLEAKNIFKAYTTQAGDEKIEDYQIFYAVELLSILRADAFGYVPTEREGLPAAVVSIDRKNQHTNSIKLENVLLMAFQKIVGLWDAGTRDLDLYTLR